jgi:hypothetical protein
LAEFGLDGAGDANFAELALQQIGRPMIARFEIGEVLLATSIGNVLRQLRLAVVPGDASLPHHFAEGHSIHLGEFGGLTERQRSLGIQRDSELSPEALRDFRFGNA